MYFLFWLFMTKFFAPFISSALQDQYIAGAVLLGTSYLVKLPSRLTQRKPWRFFSKFW
jgi:hypothetical protein